MNVHWVVWMMLSVGWVGNLVLDRVFFSPMVRRKWWWIEINDSTHLQSPICIPRGILMLMIVRCYLYHMKIETTRNPCPTLTRISPLNSPKSPEDQLAFSVASKFPTGGNAPLPEPCVPRCDVMSFFHLLFVFWKYFGWTPTPFLHEFRLILCSVRSQRRPLDLDSDRL